MASTRRISLIAGMATIAALALPSAASAAVTCSLSSGVLDVSISSGTTQVSIQRGTGGGSNDIDVYDGFFNGTLQACTGSPTVSNTDSIQINDGVAGQNSFANVGLQNGALEPGATPEVTGTSEIEVTFNASDGTDTLRVFGGTATPDNYTFGQTAVNAIGGSLNGDADVDDVTAIDAERLNVTGGNAVDDISANGGTGFTGPVPYNNGGSAVLRLDGGANDDHLTAGPGGWTMDASGGAGNDTLTGGSGSDEIAAGDSGNDLVDGGTGTLDTVSYQFAPGGVHFDLGIIGPQNTAVAGTDTAVNVEGIVGSQQTSPGDVLIGDGGNNSFFANAGDDLIIPKGGNDTVAAGLGSDSVSYGMGSSGPVTVSLGTTAAQVTGGAGIDSFADNSPSDGLPDVENLIGSPFGGDVLTGNSLLNSLDVYDGFGDSADCIGPAGGNVGIGDEVGADSISNCDTTDHAPQTSIDSGPAPGASSLDPSPTYGLSSDEVATFQYSVDAGTFVSCPASCTIPSLSVGTHTLAFRAIDADENLHADLTPASRTLTVTVASPPDTSAPDTSVSGKAKVRTRKKRARVSFTLGATEAGSSFACSLDGGPFAPCTSPFSAKLRRGAHTLSVRATDASGNADSTPATFTTKVVKRHRR
jgi:hypothetical protein